MISAASSSLRGGSFPSETRLLDLSEEVSLLCREGGAGSGSGAMDTGATSSPRTSSSSGTSSTSSGHSSNSSSELTPGSSLHSNSSCGADSCLLACNYRVKSTSKIYEQSMWCSHLQWDISCGLMLSVPLVTNWNEKTMKLKKDVKIVWWYGCAVCMSSGAWLECAWFHFNADCSMATGCCTTVMLIYIAACFLVTLAALLKLFALYSLDLTSFFMLFLSFFPRLMREPLILPEILIS